MENLGDRIKYLRKKAHLSQKDLGNIVELHDSNISRIEKGTVFPTADILLKIALYFNTSCDWLLLGDEADIIICENADEATLIQLYRRLLPLDQEEILALINYKLQRAISVTGDKSKLSLSENTSQQNIS